MYTVSSSKNWGPVDTMMQKCLSTPCSSSKRSLFRENKNVQKDTDGHSDADSDLGPMSPLALTDQSSCDSSPGRQFISPLATPEKSPVIPLTNWSRLMSSYHLNNAVPETPGKDSDFDDQQSYVEETPQKEEYSENRLITPLGSMCKNIPIPKVHRRKSLGVLDIDECKSPEIKKCSFKRHLDDSMSLSSSKSRKIDAFSSSIPKARAALFKDDNENTSGKGKSFSLTTKSFYGSNVEKSRKSEVLAWREPQRDIKKRRSLPTYSSQRRVLKKHKAGEINCGVWHGIKRPKPKRQTNVVKSENDNVKNKTKVTKENLNPQTKKLENKQPEKQLILKRNMPIEKDTQEIDPNKKFFKSKLGQNAVVTVNEKIKLQVPLSQVKSNHVNKKAKLNNLSFDATDLSVDEPSIEKSLEQSKVNNILKILDDWSDDDSEAMDTTQNIESKTFSPRRSPRRSPRKSMLKNLTMSPGSELSNMTSSMNIKDVMIPLENQASENSNNINCTTEVSQKLYPLFSKNYIPKIINDENPKKRKRSNLTWQLSAKHGNAEDQYQIDAGQKMFGATQCNECGIVYHIGDPDDENSHLNYHNSFKILKFQGWKNERIVYQDAYTSSRIIVIDPKDSNLYWKKVNEILEMVDRDLGLSDTKLSCYKDKRVYMYVQDKTILGVLVAEYVKSAFRMIPELIDLNCCTSEPTPVKCGINVVWTAMSHRRQGIATKLVDTLRTTYFYGCILSVEDIAFSTPTPSGKQFAEKYTKSPNFKVY